MNYRTALKRKIKRCKRARIIWAWILRKNPNIAHTAIVLMPSFDGEENYYALQYLDQLVVNMHRDNAAIITCDVRVVRYAKELCQKLIKAIRVRGSVMACLLDYAALYKFDDRLVVASLTLPNGRGGERLIGMNGLTKEELIAVGIYGLPNFQKAEDTPLGKKVFGLV